MYGFASILKLFWLSVRLIGEAPVDINSIFTAGGLHDVDVW